MIIHDISMTIDENIPVHEDKVSRKPINMVENDFVFGDFYESSIKMNLHTGTHIDAPLYMINNGSTIDDYPIEKFFTKCKVFDFTCFVDTVEKEDVLGKIDEDDFIIVKTRKKTYYFENEICVHLGDSFVKYLLDMNIKGLGIDSFQIEDENGDSGNHKLLLKNKIPIIGNLNLENIKEGTYLLVALPLKLKGVEASPTRAILIEDFYKITVK